mmetsp:Transcript_7835/g.11793  ORF Transcript_7835/g.11793 Transcript_7835/m.11793 type:complete len:1121 (+) Transcript_7835:93-3455(+)
MNGGLHRNNLAAEEDTSAEIEMDEQSQQSSAASSPASSNSMNETGSNNGTDDSGSSLDIDKNLGIIHPGKSLLVGGDFSGGDFSLRLPNLGDLHRTDSNASRSTNDSQYYHSVRSIESDEYYRSEDSDLSYFNAKQILATDSEMDNFRDANEYDSQSENADEGGSIYAASEYGGHGDNDSGLGLGSIEAFNYQGKDRSQGGNSQGERPRWNNRGEIDFLTDAPKKMTYGRRIGIHLAKKYAWYNPQLKKDVTCAPEVEERGVQPKPPKASIQLAWAYFERMTLPRHKYIPNNQREPPPDDREVPKVSSFDSLTSSIRKTLFKGDRDLQIANPGEDSYETVLYHPITTPLKQMGDFGLGVGLYFATLLAMTVLMVLAGLMNIPNFRYFGSEDYSDGQQGVSWFLKGSAVCNVHEWVPCPECDADEFKTISDRIVSVNNTDGNGPMTFALRNTCDGAIFRVGMVNFGTTILVLVGVIVMRIYLKKKEVEFDLDEQTAQDYSIAVRNPPDDAVSPEEWRDFFMTNFHGSHVTCCTVAVDNDALVYALVARRELLKTIEGSLPDEHDFSIENLKKIAGEREAERNSFQRVLAKFSGGIPASVHKLVVLNDKIVDLSQQSWPASTVFVTFENEKAQRLVLEKMLVAQIDAKRQNQSAVEDPNLLFRGEHVCFIEEPAEPSAIRWQDLGVTKKEVAIKFLTTGFVFVLLAVSFFVIQLLHDVDPTFAAYAISISNAIFPTLAKTLSKCEKHANEERREVWLYIKIAIFRCLNTVVVILIITPFTSTTLGNNDDLLAGVYNIFFAEIVTVNVLQLLDIGENFKRHILAPRAKTQDAMNLNMRGTETFLAERYTNMTKLVFLAIWYCPLYPGVLFMCAAALFINFFVDRFSLMRSWKPSPKLGRSMSTFTRDFVFPIIVITMAFVAVRSWSYFTYDHLCSDGTTTNSVDSTIYGTYKIPGIDGMIDALDVQLESTSIAYEYCRRNTEFPTEQQERLIDVYGAFAYTVAGIVSVVIIGVVVFYLKQLYVASYNPCGEAQEKPYSEVESRTAYIPQVKSQAFAFPFLACPVAKIRDCDLFEWEDPHKPYDDYDITEDARQLLIDSGKQLDSSLAVFSQMFHCPPPEKDSK